MFIQESPVCRRLAQIATLLYVGSTYTTEPIFTDSTIAVAMPVRPVNQEHSRWIVIEIAGNQQISTTVAVEPHTLAFVR